MGIDIRMGVKTKKLRSAEELRKLNYRFMEASDLGWDKSPITLEDYKRNGDYFYELNSLSRYYSGGYSRGHFPEIYCAIEWLRQNFPEGEVLYGPDQYSIDETSVFSKQDQEELLQFWTQNGSLNYRYTKPDHPGLYRECPNCKEIMSQFMWGGGQAGIRCLGCKYVEVTKDDGKTWEEIKKE